MGRIKTTLIKRVTEDILKKHIGEFKDNFEENKEILDKIVEIKSKKIRNAIAGYITRIKKSEVEAS